MTTAAHTPGPWKFEHWGSQIVDSGAGSSQLLIATVAINTYHDQGRYNAALIAAAPDLLEALVLLEREMIASGNAGSVDYGWKPAIEKTRAAIAKARGAA